MVNYFFFVFCDTELCFLNIFRTQLSQDGGRCKVCMICVLFSKVFIKFYVFTFLLGFLWAAHDSMKNLFITLKGTYLLFSAFA